MCFLTHLTFPAIQGRDCLIQKFRNSSVMLEPTHYRPKVYSFYLHKFFSNNLQLFFTLTDPAGRPGEEDSFPASDNASKLKRSCENAEHVGKYIMLNFDPFCSYITGLFAPSAGQHMRDEQRRRRSQYDRGTSLAELEDYPHDGQYSLYDHSYAQAQSCNWPWFYGALDQFLTQY